MSVDDYDSSWLQDDPTLPVLVTSELEMLGVGISGVVYAIDEHTVVKIAPVWDSKYTTDEGLRDLRIERAIYDHVGSHPRIVRYIKPVRRGIVLERFGEPLRKHLQELHEKGMGLTYDQALKWSCQVAQALGFLHKNDVAQGDIGCHNVLLKGDDVKLCDFGGSSLEGKPATAGYDVRFQRWDETRENPSILNEIFALGSAIYEIWTTTLPCQDEDDETVEQKFKDQRFPDVSALPVGTIITNCWYSIYHSADEIVAALEVLRTQ